MPQGGQPNMQQLMQQAQKLQAQLATAQEELAAREVTGTSGGGLVTATVKGTGDLVGLVIDSSVVDPSDTETLADLVVAAVRDAGRAAAELTEQLMPSMPGGLGGGGGSGSGGPMGLPGLTGTV